jgi:hypothetical protein
MDKIFSVDKRTGKCFARSIPVDDNGDEIIWTEEGNIEIIEHGVPDYPHKKEEIKTEKISKGKEECEEGEED